MVGPLYRQIADALRQKIESGEYEPGTQLPTEDELITEYRMSRNTVRAAIKELATAGLVETRHGIGTFVPEVVLPIVTSLTADLHADRGGGEGLVYTAEVARSGRRATNGETKVGVERATAAVADALKIPEGSEVVTRHEPRYVDDLPWSLQTSFYPKSVVERAPRLLEAAGIKEGTVAYVATCGIEQVGYWDALEVRTPDEAETSFFRLHADGRIQVVEIYRVAFDQDANRIRLTVTVYRADRNRFMIKVGKVPPNEGQKPGKGKTLVSRLLDPIA
jgi:GntR family transcriptional regulator